MTHLFAAALDSEPIQPASPAVMLLFAAIMLSTYVGGVGKSGLFHFISSWKMRFGTFPWWSVPRVMLRAKRPPWLSGWPISAAPFRCWSFPVMFPRNARMLG